MLGPTDQAAEPTVLPQPFCDVPPEPIEQQQPELTDCLHSSLVGLTGRGVRFNNRASPASQPTQPSLAGPICSRPRTRLRGGHLALLDGHLYVQNVRSRSKIGGGWAVGRLGGRSGREMGSRSFCHWVVGRSLIWLVICILVLCVCTWSYGVTMDWIGRVGIGGR
jgi:hypothetical protein